MSKSDPFGARGRVPGASGSLDMFRLSVLQDQGLSELDKIPMTVKVLLENLLRSAGTGFASEDDVSLLAHGAGSHSTTASSRSSRPGSSSRTSPACPAVVDLAAMRSAMEREGGDASKVDPLVPVDLVIDHSVQVDAFGTLDGLRAQRRARVRTEPRAVLAPPVGAAGLRRLQRRASGHGDRPPGEPRVHREGRPDDLR